MVGIQEESAALLNQMFAQQMAGNQSYMDSDMGRALGNQPQPASVLFDSRAVPGHPHAGLYDAQDGVGGGGSKGGGGSRSSAPNPFENLTGLPFKAQAESGESYLPYPAVLCHAMLCYDMMCCATLRCAVLCYAMLCYAMLCYAIYPMPYMLCHARLRYAIPLHPCCCVHQKHYAQTCPCVFSFPSPPSPHGPVRARMFSMQSTQNSTVISLFPTECGAC